MKIGFVNIYSFRPHVEHLYYLANLMESSGHETFFLTCDAGVSSCYPRELKNSSKLKECSKCIAGGVRGFPVSNISSVKNHEVELDYEVLDELSLSSSCTLHRTESELEWNEEEVVELREKLHKPINDVYKSAISWIEDKSLDAVVCFNGRMDLPRAVTYACEQKGIPYVTHERTWLGDGLQLIPNANCLSLKAVNDMIEVYDKKPLKGFQASIAAKFAGERFLQKNSLEWRLYNKNPDPVKWPLKANGPRVLVLPSSKNEFAGHEEWKTQWRDNTEALDDFMAAFKVHPEQVILRCHPNWAENIGKVFGGRSLSLYKRWAENRGIYCISSEEKASTYDLIQQADIVVLNGGSSAVEAGVCGKQVICLGPSTYQKAGFVRTFLTRDELFDGADKGDLDPDSVIRKTLRFIYLRSHRYPQFVEHVKAIETTRYEYYDGADADRLVNIFESGMLEPDDASYALRSDEEDAIIDILRERDWASAADLEIESEKAFVKLDIGRRKSLRWLDYVREKMPRGDRA